MLKRGQEDNQITSYLQELENKERKKRLFMFSGIGVGIVVLCASIFLLISGSISPEEQGPSKESEFAEGKMEEEFASQYEVFNEGSYFAEGVILSDYDSPSEGIIEDFIEEPFGDEDFPAEDFADRDPALQELGDEIEKPSENTISPVAGIENNSSINTNATESVEEISITEEDVIVKKNPVAEETKSAEAVEEKPTVNLPETSSPTLTQIQERGDKKKKKSLASADGISAPTIKKKTDQASSSGIIDRADKMPSFPGGAGAMYRFLRDNINYPASAMKESIEGQVLIQVIVNEEGQITQPRVLKSLGQGCDQEALRLISKMPDWIPGSKQGKAVKVRRNIPVTFLMPK